MKEAIKKNKKFIIIGLVIIVLLLIGIAFAYLTTTLQGDKEYLVRAGTLDLVLEEGNELTLEKQIPIEDSEGQSLNGFNFSLVNHGSIDTDYTIYLDDIALDEGKTKHQAIVCIMRRTCNIIYGILKNETEYIPPKQLVEQCQNSFRERKKLEEKKRKKKEERKKRDIANINSNC